MFTQILAVLCCFCCEQERLAGYDARYYKERKARDAATARKARWHALAARLNQFL